jgi:hypothetical protein
VKAEAAPHPISDPRRDATFASPANQFNACRVPALPRALLDQAGKFHKRAVIQPIDGLEKFGALAANLRFSFFPVQGLPI